MNTVRIFVTSTYNLILMTLFFCIWHEWVLGDWGHLEEKGLSVILFCSIYPFLVFIHTYLLALANKTSVRILISLGFALLITISFYGGNIFSQYNFLHFLLDLFSQILEKIIPILSVQIALDYYNHKDRLLS